MDQSLLKMLMNNEFYRATQSKLRPSLFASNDAEVFNLIVEAQDKYEHDVTPQDVLTMWKVKNPVATRAESEDFLDTMMSVRSQDALSEDIAKDAVDSLWRREIGSDIANLGLSINEGNLDAMQKLKSLMLRMEDGFMPDDFGEATTDDLYQPTTCRDIRRQPLEVQYRFFITPCLWHRFSRVWYRVCSSRSRKVCLRG